MKDNEKTTSVDNFKELLTSKYTKTDFQVGKHIAEIHYIFIKKHWKGQNIVNIVDKIMLENIAKISDITKITSALLYFHENDNIDLPINIAARLHK